MPMSDEVKARLAEAAKRKRGVLLKDLEPTFLKVACDAVIEKCGGVLEWSDRLSLSHPKRWKPDQVEAVLEHLPHRWAVLRDPSTLGEGRISYRAVPMFLKHHLECLLKTCGIADGKLSTYVSWYDPAVSWKTRPYESREEAELRAARFNGHD